MITRGYQEKDQGKKQSLGMQYNQANQLKVRGQAGDCPTTSQTGKTEYCAQEQTIPKSISNIEEIQLLGRGVGGVPDHYEQY